MAAISAPHDEALAAEQAKLLRDGRHVRACQARELRHAPFTLGEALEQLQPTYVTRSAKDRGRAIERFVRKSRPRLARRVFVFVVFHLRFTTSRLREVDEVVPRHTSSVKHFVVSNSVGGSKESVCRSR